MIKSQLVDPKTGSNLKVNEDGSIDAFVIPSPPKNISQVTLPFAQYMSNNGDSTGSSVMNINGSTTNVDFYVSAKQYDVYINTIVFTIADAGATLDKFGNITALTNGLEFFYFNQDIGRYVIESGLKSNFDFIRLANFEPSFGTGADAFKATNVIGTSEAYVGVIDLEDIFGVQWGLKLTANSTDRIGFAVKDDISAIDLMTAKCYGLRVHS